MDKKTQGLSREVLFASGIATSIFGFQGGDYIQGGIGVAISLLALTLSFFRHKKRGGGAVKWSIIRKFINGAGTALISYEIMDKSTMNTVLMFVGFVGPVIASASSVVTNDDDTHPRSNGKIPLFLLGALMSFFTMGLSSCAYLSNLGAEIDNEGCAQVTYRYEDQTYKAGPCIQNGEVYAYRVNWENDEGVQLRATRYEANSSYVVEYTFDGSWATWSSKSGIDLGNTPVEL